MVGTTTGLEEISHKDVKNGFTFLFKGIMLGQGGVGKTSFLQRFSKDEFSPTYAPTTGLDFAVKCFRSGDGEYIKIQVWDTPGQDQYRTISNSYYRGTHGIMILFDVGDESTFKALSGWKREADVMTLKGTPQILVGNKSDLEGKRQVSREEAEKFAEENGLQYVESSAKDGSNVSEAFQIFTLAMVKKQKERRAQLKEKPMTKGLASGSQSSTGNQKSKSCTVI